MKKYRALIALIAVLDLTRVTAVAADLEVKTTAYVGAQLIDGTGTPARPDMTIVVRDERIIEVMPASQFSAPQGTEIVDMRGHYVVPGLINVHEHMNTPPKASYTLAMMRRELYGGVTAVLDPADDLRLLSEIARAARLNEVPSPDIHYAAMMAGPSFYADPRTIASSSGGTAGHVPWMQAITDDTDLTLAIAMARGTSATGIKIYADLPGSLVGKLTREARRQGMQVWAHSMVFPATPQEVVEAGVDSVSHVCYAAFQAVQPRPPTYHSKGTYAVPHAGLADGSNPIMQALFEDMARRQVILDQTLWIWTRTWFGESAAKDGAQLERCDANMAVNLTRQAYRAGVTLATGTDGFSPWDDPYTSLHTEMDLLQQRVGLTPLEVIKAATLNGARVLGQQAHMGSIEAGKLANFVFVAKDPAVDVGNLRSVVLTVKRGQRYPRADYVPLTKEEGTTPPMPTPRPMPVPAAS